MLPSAGLFYTAGMGVAKKKAQAAKFFKLAADQGHVDALVNLGKY